MSESKALGLPVINKVWFLETKNILKSPVIVETGQMLKNYPGTCAEESKLLVERSWEMEE